MFGAIAGTLAFAIWITFRVPAETDRAPNLNGDSNMVPTADNVSDPRQADRRLEEMMLAGGARTSVGLTLITSDTKFETTASTYGIDEREVVAAATKRVEIWRTGGYVDYKTYWAKLGRKGEPFWKFQLLDEKARTAEANFDAAVDGFRSVQMQWDRAQVVAEQIPSTDLNERFRLQGSAILSWEDASLPVHGLRDMAKGDPFLWRPISSVDFRSKENQVVFVLVPFTVDEGEVPDQNMRSPSNVLGLSLSKGENTGDEWLVFEIRVVAPRAVFMERFVSLPR